MKSKLASSATRSNWVFFIAHNRALRRGLASASTSRTADPAIHSGDPQGIDAEEAVKAATFPQQKEDKPSKENEPFVFSKIPYASSPKLESSGVNQPLDPTIQQKRHNTIALEDVSCVGLDGTPLSRDEEEWQRQGEVQEEDDNDYYKHHKASPLSEIEFADTRKPITQATDGTAGNYDVVGGVNVIGWRPEQLDTAEEALRRATEIWRQSAMRGDPDSPQSRVLRALRGENW